MDKTIKIFAGIMITLGALSGIFLLTAKKKTSDVNVPNQNKVTKTSEPIKQNQVPNEAQSASQIGQLPVLDKIEEPAVTNQQLPNQSVETKNDQAVQTGPQTAPKQTLDQKKQQMMSQWEKCKSSNIASGEKLTWIVKITEGIPMGGTYAKGYLEQQSYPVQITISSESEISSKINELLTPGKNAILRVTCKGVATDGSVMVQAY